MAFVWRGRSPSSRKMVTAGAGRGCAGMRKAPTWVRASTCGRQRVSRCDVDLRQRGQNFISSKRSGVLRRFFLVM